ncbi:MAG: peptidylprolyl isomerase [Luteolibacter sp.]|jgi:parvulin-like peptidyl-prolyl isomerase|nr:peptidylprolyl isomerase [Luteolibacter sp.]
MSPLAKFSLRLALYGLVIAWLAGDLFLFHGPLRRKIDLADPSSQEAIAAAKNRGVVARVFNHQITRGQLERAVYERLWLEGKSPADISPQNLKILRYAALDELIDHELLRVKAKANALHLKVSGEEINERLRRLLGRFESKGAMESAMKSQGIASEQALRDRIAARIQQEKYVLMRIGPLSQVTDEEARSWFAENESHLATPERAEVRHVFIATLERTPEEAKTALDTALADLTAGKKDFATLARELSEDPATKDKGGALGWMTRERLPAGFAAAVFTLPLQKPSLVRGSLGWHLVEVTARLPVAPRSFEDAQAEVLAALEAVKRQQAISRYRDALRRFEAAKIDVFHDMIAGP